MNEMRYNDQHNVNKALRDVFHMRDLRGASRAYEVELPLIQKTIRAESPDQTADDSRQRHRRFRCNKERAQMMSSINITCPNYKQKGPSNGR